MVNSTPVDGPAPRSTWVTQIYSSELVKQKQNTNLGRSEAGIWEAGWEGLEGGSGKAGWEGLEGGIWEGIWRRRENEYSQNSVQNSQRRNNFF